MDKTVLLGSEEARESLFEGLESRLRSAFDDQTTRDLFLLVAVEAVNNAVEHGNSNDPKKRITVHSLIQPELALVSVRDEGVGFTPSFPDLKKVEMPRGLGLGLIRANSDLVFFNQTGNQIIFLKGGVAMARLLHSAARIQLLPKGVILISEVEPKVDVFKALSEIFDQASSAKSRKIFLDLKGIALISSTVWGTIFAQAAETTVELIVLFNTSKAIRTAAQQMAIADRHGHYDKIHVLADADEALKIMAGALGRDGS